MSNAIKILIPLVSSFVVGFVITPILTKYFYKYKLWKRSSRSNASVSKEFQDIHNEKEELKTPRVGGMIIWLSVFITIMGIALLEQIFPNPWTQKLNFLSRSQTLIPLGTLILGGMLGLFDDLAQVFSSNSYGADALSNRRVKIAMIVAMSLLVGLWFVLKLDHSSVFVPFIGSVPLGLMFIPFFILVTLAVFSSSIIDGMDGLSGGVLVPIFASYTLIAYTNNQIDLAAFSSVVTGSILVFLWFNIPPARFYMGETGMLGLTLLLSVIAFLTDAVFVLPLIALPLVATSLSAILQIYSYKYRNKKRIFLVAPLHHHFEAKGWSRPKVTMRYWIVSIVCSVFGTIIYILTK